MTNMKKPELLAPAGTYSAFVAAICAGADAVYMGGARHNARIGAKNFTEEELARTIDEAHFFGKKVYITLNTLVTDRELSEVLDYAEKLLTMGADALIVQDLGLIKALSLAFPQAELHASTQCITHSLDGINTLAEMGVKRAVIARELDRENIQHICRKSPVEIEAFVHGALCVCHSGACLFSSLVGGRSGNRGECAQPCRLPYKVKGYDSEYPLSLCDLSLSNHLTDLTEAGVASLKIEGRMKSDIYVGAVVGIFRELLDMGRNADKKDLDRLAKIFSRGGFTDGYYTGKLGKKMYGVRSAEDKDATRKIENEAFQLPKIPLDAKMTVGIDGAVLTLAACNKTSSAKSSPPDIALNKPIDEAFAKEQISKLGNTVFELHQFDFSADGNYILPKSALNALRREALEGLSCHQKPLRNSIENPTEKKPRKYEKYVVLAPHRTDEHIPKSVDRVYFPLFKVPSQITEKTGVALPVIIKDSEKEAVAKELLRLKENGVKFAYAESLGSAKLALSMGFLVIGGTRINAYNSHTLKVLADMGFEGAVLSCELTAPVKRDMTKALPTGEIIRGRAPLMIMENCIMNLRDSCRECSDFKTCRKHTVLIDRKGVSFPVYPEYFHRCQIYNSVTTYNADKISSDASFGIIYVTDEKSIEEAVMGNIPKEYTRKG